MCPRPSATSSHTAGRPDRHRQHLKDSISIEFTVHIVLRVKGCQQTIGRPAARCRWMNGTATCSRQSSSKMSSLQMSCLSSPPFTAGLIAEPSPGTEYRVRSAGCRVPSTESEVLSTPKRHQVLSTPYHVRIAGKHAIYRRSHPAIGLQLYDNSGHTPCSMWVAGMQRGHS